ncbi:MAG: hypothetical protein CBD27_09730 [Rhodospirillaceae bacterium TMED167]|nr:MAG: hypothetical protein CBD27_09730 [Rhodospirillaceae bacterium TMED167]|tara:strand:+ start:137 stop:1051 length:915 start_codon:yes stop_codon:yes gene_type:complete
MNLFAKVALDTRDWSRGINKMKSSSKSFGSQIGRDLQGRVASMFAVERVFSGFVSMYEKAADIRDNAMRYDTDTDTYQKMASAAAKARVPVDRLYDAVKDLTVKQRDAVNGSKSWLKVFEDYGFQLEDLKDKAPVEMFQDLARAVSASSKSMSEILAHMDDLMSDPGAELAPFMKRGDFNQIENQKVPLSSGQVENMAGASDDLRGAWSEFFAGLMKFFNDGSNQMLEYTISGRGTALPESVSGLIEKAFPATAEPILEKWLAGKMGANLNEMRGAQMEAQLRMKKENNEALKATASAVQKMAK